MPDRYPFSVTAIKTSLIDSKFYGKINHSGIKRKHFVIFTDILSQVPGHSLVFLVTQGNELKLNTGKVALQKKERAQKRRNREPNQLPKRDREMKSYRNSRDLRSPTALK